MARQKTNTAKCIKLFLFISPFLYGGFYEWVSCLYSLILIGILFYSMYREGGIQVRKNFTLLSVAALVCSYGISMFWAVDRGMAVGGLCKFLPLLLFGLAVMQIHAEERWEILEAVPMSGSAMVILSLALRLVPGCGEYISVNGRLGGFFQYPNTFALFLLAGVILLAGKEQWKLRQIWPLPVLLAGIALTGSRTVFFLMAAAVLVLCIGLKGKRRWVLCLLLAILVAGTILYVALTGNMAGIGRYLTSSLSSSTFLGRLLYAKDALPVILRHPFGLGYMGYYYCQGSFQTGVYSVMHIHNEILQIFLDIGWIPAGLFLAAIVRGFIKQKRFTGRLLIVTMIAHCLFDFDLQFVSIGFILLLVLDWESGAARVFSKRLPWQAAGILLAGLCLWLGIAFGLYRFGQNEAAVKVYPGCTGAWISRLSQAADLEEMEQIAEKILKRNKSVSLAYSAKARAAYGKGDFANMISSKKHAISLSKYELEEYLDYFDMLYVGIQLYMENDDPQSAEFCRQRLLEIPDMLEGVLENTDGIAWKIRDKPELSLPDEYRQKLRLLEE